MLSGGETVLPDPRIPPSPNRGFAKTKRRRDMPKSYGSLCFRIEEILSLLVFDIVMVVVSFVIIFISFIETIIRIKYLKIKYSARFT